MPELICLHTVKWFQALLQFSFWFGFAWFYGISTIAGYLMPNHLDTFTLYIYYF